MIRFDDYAKIVNNYCLCYFGSSDEYLVQLRLLKPIFELVFPDITIYLGCKDEKIHLLQDCKHTLKLTEIKIKKNEFAHISEIKFNGRTHPIEDILLESSIANFGIAPASTDKTIKCLIVTKGSHPTKPLTMDQVNKLKRMAVARGMEYEIDTDIKGTGLVVGVESVQICEAAASGIETILIPTGVGSRLYKKLFPNLQLLHI